MLNLQQEKFDLFTHNKVQGNRVEGVTKEQGQGCNKETELRFLQRNRAILGFIE